MSTKMDNLNGPGRGAGKLSEKQFKAEQLCQIGEGFENCRRNFFMAISGLVNQHFLPASEALRVYFLLCCSSCSCCSCSCC
jgi:hypothetical protein